MNLPGRELAAQSLQPFGAPSGSHHFPAIAGKEAGGRGAEPGGGAGDEDDGHGH